MFASTIRSVLRSNNRLLVSSTSNIVRSNNLRLTNSILINNSNLLRKNYSDHHEESFEEFSVRYEKEFDEAYDLFEVQVFPSPSVIERALRACRRVNDYATAVRVFEGLKHKVENKEQYQAYLEELKDVREELGIDLKEELFV
ncbi:unnamed protein product [[Candida] boidinii]|uniref:Cytochrome c oxidase subunit 6, mitochondrial n=1 Tax=Candida boidinii TaxID=5477 RepID=A0A9W6T2C5_CANBO|nr:unnamed protein product [[Candida] boidinii]GME99178.1 unnamed protein product [[Candida] boidinii]